MHPPLTRPHPDCQDVIEALVDCHERHNVAKFAGACNAAKLALDQCFKKEKMTTKELNAYQAAQNKDFFNKFTAFKERKRQEELAAKKAAEDGK